MKSGMQIRKEEMGFHPIPKDQDYFEGWYYRIHDQRISLAVIVGFSWCREERSVFIQTADTISAQSVRLVFSWDQVTMRSHPFRLTIGGSTFSEDHMVLDLEHLKARLTFRDLTPLPFSWYAPTIMGPFSYLKSMECVHSVISLHHQAEGMIQTQGQSFPVLGTGYIEKDRGCSFPQEYLWFQSNQCQVENSCFFLSIASIPLPWMSFTGLLCVVRLGPRTHRFASYTGCTLQNAGCTQLQDGRTEVRLLLKQGALRIEITLIQGNAMELDAPQQGKMSGRVRESLDSEARVLIYRRSRKIHESHWTDGGMELHKKTTPDSAD